MRALWRFRLHFGEQQSAIIRIQGARKQTKPLLKECVALMKFWRDPKRRSDYDSTRRQTAGTHQESRSSNDSVRLQFNQIPCCRCGAISAQPRFCVFPWVTSLIIYAQRSYTQGVFCVACAAKEASRACGYTAALGWWSIHGFFWTISALYQNIKCGSRPDKQNANLLIRQRFAFMERGNLTLGAACFGQAIKYCSPETSEDIKMLVRDLGMDEGRIVNSWSVPAMPQFVQRIGLAMAVPLALLGLYFYENRQSTNSYPVTRNFGSQTRAMPAPQSRHEDLYHVFATGPVTLWSPFAASGSSSPLEELAPYANVYVSERINGGAGGIFAVVRTLGGRTGLVSEALLAPGDGMAAWRHQCTIGSGSPPFSGEVFLRTGYGPHQAIIENRSNQWAVVKLRNTSGRTIIAAFVGPNASATITQVPSGRFRLQFATGRDWSRYCGMFMQNMSSSQFEIENEYTTTYSANGQINSVWTYTITPVVGGNVRSRTVNNEAFSSD